MITNTLNLTMMQSGLVSLGKFMMGRKVLPHFCEASSTHVFVHNRAIKKGQIVVKNQAQGKPVHELPYTGYHVDDVDAVTWDDRQGHPVFVANREIERLFSLSYFPVDDADLNNMLIAEFRDLERFIPANRMDQVILTSSEKYENSMAFIRLCYARLLDYVENPCDQTLRAFPSDKLRNLVAPNGVEFVKAAMPEFFPVSH